MNLMESILSIYSSNMIFDSQTRNFPIFHNSGVKTRDFTLLNQGMKLLT